MRGIVPDVSDLRLDGGAAADEETASSSASRPRFRPTGGRPRFAADMLGRKGELCRLLDLLLRCVVARLDSPHCIVAIQADCLR